MTSAGSATYSRALAIVAGTAPSSITSAGRQTIALAIDPDADHVRDQRGDADGRHHRLYARRSER